MEGCSWGHASNFSLGMHLVREMIRVLGMAGILYDQFTFSIHETHHKHKKDAPSGTALAWERWLGQPANITSERTGDVIGDHSLILDTPYEQLRITHSASDRKLFASGALWAVSQVLNGNVIHGPGLYDIEQFARQVIRKIPS